MATINVNTDPSQFIGSMDDIIAALENKEQFLRPICVELSGLMNDRIHNKALASDGSKIGTYKTSYLRIREKHKHPQTETQVILVLTRKLSNSWGAFSTDNGYGVGFTDDGASEGVTALKKSEYAEKNFGKKIGDLTKDESEYVNERLIELVNEIIAENSGRS
jgi:hypothetical protein